MQKFLLITCMCLTLAACDRNGFGVGDIDLKGYGETEEFGKIDGWDGVSSKDECSFYSTCK